MVKQKETKPAKRRTQVKDLSKQEKELTKDEAKKVKGGVRDLLIFNSSVKDPTKIGGGSK